VKLFTLPECDIKNWNVPEPDFSELKLIKTSLRGLFSLQESSSEQRSCLLKQKFFSSWCSGKQVQIFKSRWRSKILHPSWANVFGSIRARANNIELAAADILIHLWTADFFASRLWLKIPPCCTAQMLINDIDKVTFDWAATNFYIILYEKTSDTTFTLKWLTMICFNSKSRPSSGHLRHFSMVQAAQADHPLEGLAKLVVEQCVNHLITYERIKGH